MWRPGDAKPQAQGKRKAPGRNNSSRNSHGSSKNRESPPGGESRSSIVEGPASVPFDQTTTSPTKKLSGALMNMKFMKRQAAQRQRHDGAKATSPHPKSGPDSRRNTTQKEQDPMDLEMEPRSPLEVHASALTTTAEATEDALVDMTPATAGDMFGVAGCVLGRRSFGGFHRSVEDTWKASYHALRDGGDRKQVSDGELLERYAKLVKHPRTNGNDEDASRRPVGNLGNKVKPRQKLMGSGEKRKRR